MNATTEDESEDHASTSTAQKQAGSKRGPKFRPFAKLADRTKDEQSRRLARTVPLEKLLRSAEKAARRDSNYAMARVLLNLRTNGENWAASFEQSTDKSNSSPSLEDALEVKTRVGLTKGKYQGIRNFAIRFCGAQLFPSWAKLMDCRNKILPKLTPPVWENGTLLVDVGLRELASNTAERLLELDHVREGLARVIIPDNKRIDCVLEVSAGLDSATSFPHYNQANILHKDDSLLTENFLPLSLVTASGKTFWLNPSPQSDLFCRAKSMRWAKETEPLTKKLFDDFYAETDEIEKNPIVVALPDAWVFVRVKAKYALVDGKAANAIVGNRDTKACPLCAPGADPRVGPHFFHSRLNIVEWLIRVCAQKKVAGNPSQSDPLVKVEIRNIGDKMEAVFKVSVNRPKPGGSGTGNTGNMARIVLSSPRELAEILGISVSFVENIRLISSLALSSHFLDSTKMKTLYEELQQQIRDELPFVRRLPPCVHKYSHIPELVEELVRYTLISIRTAFLYFTIIPAVSVEFLRRTSW